MHNFEKQLMNMNSVQTTESNSDEFLSKLHGRIQKSRQNRNTLMTGFMMIFVVGILSYSQLGVSIETELYYADETEDIFETDFWTVDIDSLEIDASYTEDLAYFLLDEGDFWDAVDLLNELTNEEEITL
jgi:hypothetical protein